MSMMNGQSGGGQFGFGQLPAWLQNYIQQMQSQGVFSGGQNNPMGGAGGGQSANYPIGGAGLTISNAMGPGGISPLMGTAQGWAQGIANAQQMPVSAQQQALIRQMGSGANSPMVNMSGPVSASQQAGVNQMNSGNWGAPTQQGFINQAGMGPR